MRVVQVTLLLLGLACAAAPVLGEQGPRRWGYQAGAGPAHWARVAPEYHRCRSGQRQSPIDVRGFSEAALPPLDLRYWRGATGLRNSGHSVALSFPPGNRLTIDGADYALHEVHFHTPAEHRVEGRRYALEAHFVHRSAGRGVAVIAVVYDTGAADPVLAQFIDAVPRYLGQANHLPDRPRPIHLLPASTLEYYRYYGSLTTPPCTEPVLWLIMKQPRSASAEQIATLRAAIDGPNNRPLQPRNGRHILR